MVQAVVGTHYGPYFHPPVAGVAFSRNDYRWNARIKREDGMARLVSRYSDARAERLEFEVPSSLAKYIARKGSVCLDGVSLTINEVDGCNFSVCLIPHTLEVTTLGDLSDGDPVNLEVDLVARYLERLYDPALENGDSGPGGDEG